MDKLIRDLEAATEGSRELDKEIADLTIGPDRIAYGEDARYTRSLDAARTLVREGWRLRLEDRGTHWYAHLDLYDHNEKNDLAGCDRVTAHGSAPTPTHRKSSRRWRRCW